MVINLSELKRKIDQPQKELAQNMGNSNEMTFILWEQIIYKYEVLLCVCMCVCVRGVCVRACACVSCSHQVTCFRHL